MMLPELGLFCVIVALALSVMQVVLSCTKLATLPIMRPITMGQTFFVVIATMFLWYAFVSDDFSVQYVAQNSNSNLPLHYKFSALWGGHEGSLLLWILILNIWGMLVALRAHAWPHKFANSVLLVFATVNSGFLGMLLYSANPFARLLSNVPLDGMDLNPLLQDFGMMIHPPILYAGYVGSTVAFALAIAALLTRNIDQTWARLVQPWVQASWLFLTLGIALGSWWAYYELGWGGWWFWDPVENASFMPWLTATALLHCLTVAKKTGRFLALAVFLAIVTFALSLLGTFLVRSGIIVSVHAFAADPQRGVVILQFFALLLGATIILYTVRMPQIIVVHNTPLQHNEKLIFANNILLLVAAGAVLLGTLYPIVYDACTGTKIAVGYPYFNAVFIPLMLILFAIMLPGLLGKRKSILALLSCLFLSGFLLYLWFGRVQVYACIGVCLSCMIIATCFNSKHLSMVLGHLGLAISMLGISITPNYEIERDVRLQVGDELQIADYTVKFADVQPVTGANYVGWRADFAVHKAQKLLTTLHPEKLVYLARETSISETAIMPGLWQDIYIALGQKLDHNVWATRIYYKPFVRWIWLGAIIMACGAAVGMLQRKFALRTFDLVETKQM